MAANQQGQQTQTGQTKNVPAGQNIDVQRGGRTFGGLIRRDDLWPGLTTTPFSFMRRIMDDMDRMVEGGGLGRDINRGLRNVGIGGQVWAPDVDVFERDGKLTIRADLPGMERNDINVNVLPDSIVIQGEKRFEHENNRQGLYTVERSYGSFYRAIPLPDGVTADDATATFRNGVLEIEVKLPDIKARTRKLDIQEGTTTPTASTTRH